jgi:hypothetical protein
MLIYLAMSLDSVTATAKFSKLVLGVLQNRQNKEPNLTPILLGKKQIYTTGYTDLKITILRIIFESKQAFISLVHLI